jgi:MFS family permease
VSVLCAFSGRVGDLMTKTTQPLATTSSNKIYPWIAITISALYLFYKYILQVSPGIMTNELMKAFHVHGAGLGNLAATFFYSYMITQLFVGVLLDKYSSRYLSAIAIAIAAIGAYLFSTAHTLLEAQLSRAMMGVGAAFATVSYMKIAAMWFKPSQFAFISGLLATAAMMGAVFGEAPLSYIVDTRGWRHGLFFCAILGIIIAILFVAIIRDKKSRSTSTSSLQAKQTSPIRLVDVAAIFSKGQNWLLTFYSGLAFSPVAVFGGLWGNQFLEETHHLSKTSAATLISLIFIGLAVGGPALGFISDRLKNRKKVLFYGTSLSLISITAIIYINTLPLFMMTIFLFLFGFGTGAFMLGFAIGKEINKIHLAATVIALINTGDAFFGAYTEPLIGKFLDMGSAGRALHGTPYFSIHDYHQAFLLIPIYLLIAIALVFFIKDSGTAITASSVDNL